MPATRWPEQIANRGLSQVGWLVYQFMRAHAGKIDAEILQELPGRICQTLGVVDGFALVHPIFLADARVSLQEPEALCRDKGRDLTKGQMEDKLGARTVVRERDLAEPLRVQLAQIAALQILPGVVAVQEVDPVVANRQQIDGRDAQPAQSAEGNGLAGPFGLRDQLLEALVEKRPKRGHFQRLRRVGHQGKILAGEPTNQGTNVTLVEPVALRQKRGPDCRVAQSVEMDEQAPGGIVGSARQQQFPGELLRAIEVGRRLELSALNGVRQDECLHIVQSLAIVGQEPLAGSAPALQAEEQSQGMLDLLGLTEPLQARERESISGKGKQLRRVGRMHETTSNHLLKKRVRGARTGWPEVPMSSRART